MKTGAAAGITTSAGKVGHFVHRHHDRQGGGNGFKQFWIINEVPGKLHIQYIRRRQGGQFIAAKFRTVIKELFAYSKLTTLPTKPMAT
jgi:hypothetical protein